jgi:phage tail protein X
LLVRGIANTPLATLLGLVLCVLIAIGAFILGRSVAGDDETKNQPVAQAISTMGSNTPGTPPPTAIPTNTRPAPPLYPTITPTMTETPTPAPCIKSAREGDTVYGLAQQCGHRHLSIVPIILTQNPGLECEACLKIGQTIEIPWPTSTPGEDTSAASPPGEANGGDANVAPVVNEFGTPDALATFYAEPTLRPGLMWHVVQDGQYLTEIIGLYNADAKVLSDINPEIEFRQCDYGLKYGGPNCSVTLYAGQRIRVPAPTPTPTLRPTLSGSETPTPTPTATYNVPELFMPEDGATFGADSLITLRWSASGTLATNENYLVTVANLDTRQTFQARTRDQFLVVPAEWQPRSGRTQDFEWVVAVAVLEGDQVVSTRQQTLPRRFTWQGQP